MELELKHLAPYLPYGLQIEWVAADKILLTPDCITEVIERQFKPILRHLPSITIDHISEINTYCKGDCQSWGDIKYRAFTKTRALLSGEKAVWIHNYLISKHYDVFELILAGLAIQKQ